VQVPVSLYGQYVGEDEAGGLPAKKMYLAGADYSSALNEMPYQLYAEWADTRTNGESVGGNIRIDPMNRINGRVLFAKLSDAANRPNVRAINAAFPVADEIKALDLTWTHYLRPDLPLKLNGWVSDSDRQGNDAGASIGIELPLDKRLFSY